MRDQEILGLQEAYASIYAPEKFSEEVEIAAQYFYNLGLNDEGVEIFIEELGVEDFCEFVYDLADEYVLTEATETRLQKKPLSLKGPKGSKPQSTTKRRVAKQGGTEISSSARPGSTVRPGKGKRGEKAAAAAETAEKNQPKKRPFLDAIARQVSKGMERHNAAMSAARETGKTIRKAAGKISGVAREVSRGASGTARLAGHLASKGLNDEFEGWVNGLVEEGYDLSEYTWDDMYEIYMEEVDNLDEARRDPRGRPASGPMSVYGGKGTPSPDPEGDDNVSRMDRAQRRVKRTKPAAMGMAADALNTKYSARQRGMSHGSEEGPGPKAPKRSGRRGRGANTDRGGGNAASRRVGREPGSFREEYDLFDTILEHLVAEGYADTNEAALVIMANMSEEWRESILIDEGLFGGGGRVSGIEARDKLNQMKGPNLKGPQSVKDTTLPTPDPLVPLASKSKPNNSQTA